MTLATPISQGVDLDAATDALFARLATLADFKRTGRRLPPWHDVAPAEEMPALFLAVVDDTPLGTEAVQRTGNAGWQRAVHVYLYAGNGEGTALSPQQILCPLVAGVRTLLKAGPGDQAQTLGGTCRAANISGTIEYFEGTLGDVGVVKVPITIHA